MNIMRMTTMRTAPKHAASSRRRQQARPSAMTIEEFRRDRVRAVAIASRPGGLLVEDETGKLIFHMVVPNTAISDISE